MGQAAAKAVSGLLDLGKLEVKIVMGGLDASGKTTILYKLKLGEIVTTIPTIGFNLETVDYRNIKFTVWDTGGRDKLRPLFRHYYPNTHGFVYVVDCNDRERLMAARNELAELLRDDNLRDAVLLVFANKQDLPGALSVGEVRARLGLDKMLCGRTWHIQAACATSGDGLHEGLEWLGSELSKKLAGNGARSVFSAVGSLLWSGNDAKPKEQEQEQEHPKAPDDPKPETQPQPQPQPAKPARESEPTLIQRAAATAEASLEHATFVPEAARASIRPASVLAHLSDAEFLAQFEAGNGLPKEELTHGSILRYVRLCLASVVDRQKGRQQAVDRILHTVKAAHERVGLIFHLTQTYFWIQLVDLAAHMPAAGTSAEEKTQAEAEAEAEEHRPSASAEEAAKHPESVHPEAEAFIRFVRQHLWLGDPGIIVHYYSYRLIFNTPQSVTEFVLPDVRPLPSVLKFNIRARDHAE